MDQQDPLQQIAAHLEHILHRVETLDSTLNLIIQEAEVGQT